MAKAKTVPKKSIKSETRKSRAKSTGSQIAVSQHAVAAKKESATKSRGFGRFKHRRHEKPATMPGKLPGSFTIIQKACLTLWSNKKVFLGIAVCYGVLSFILVSGFSSGASLNDAKDLVKGIGGNTGSVTTGLALFGILLSTRSSAASDSSNLMQMFVVVVTSLAIVWLLRHILAGEKVRIRDGFYKGMYPLIPVLLVLGVIFLQTVPFLAGASIFSILVGNAIAISWLEILLTATVFFGLLLLSLYLLSSSIIALYIATLPNMTPMTALRSATDLVRWRRWSVLRKLIFLPFAMIVIAAAIMLPFLLFATMAAPYIYALLSMVAILVVHAYLYTLYRELLA